MTMNFQRSKQLHRIKNYMKTTGGLKAKTEPVDTLVDHHKDKATSCVEERRETQRSQLSDKGRDQWRAPL